MPLGRINDNYATFAARSLIEFLSELPRRKEQRSDCLLFHPPKKTIERKSLIEVVQKGEVHRGNRNLYRCKMKEVTWDATEE